MRYLLLLLLSLGLNAELDLTIPEQPAVYVPTKEFIFNWGDYNEPPTKQQMIAFWTLNALDVYTSHQGLKNPNVSEVNPLLGKDPSLERLILHKAVVAGVLSKHSSKRYIRGVNVLLTFAVINNYEHM
jgi:hypothetical protein